MKASIHPADAELPPAQPEAITLGEKRKPSGLVGCLKHSVLWPETCSYRNLYCMMTTGHRSDLSNPVASKLILVWLAPEGLQKSFPR